MVLICSTTECNNSDLNVFKCLFYNLSQDIQIKNAIKRQNTLSSQPQKESECAIMMCQLILKYFKNHWSMTTFRIKQQQDYTREETVNLWHTTIEYFWHTIDWDSKTKYNEIKLHEFKQAVFLFIIFFLIEIYWTWIS